jgi:hypothetical protein
VLATVLFGMVLAILNASVVNVAVPALREGSAVTYGQVQFVVAAYVLGYGVFLIRALDPALTRLLAFAVAGYPQAFPQITRMTTGLVADTPKFRAAWAQFLRQLGTRLEPTRDEE